MVRRGKPLDGGYRPGYETVAERIIAFIAASGLKPGDRLPTEQALGEQLGVGHTVVREAVKMLTAVGRVRARRGSGVYVASAPHLFAMAAIDLSMPVEHEHMLSLFEFRRIQETQAVQLAAERMTPRDVRALEETVAAIRRTAESDEMQAFQEVDKVFHRGIAEGSRNPFLASAVDAISQLQGAVFHMVIAGSPESRRQAADQHAVIFDAIRQGEPEAAARAMQAHIETITAAYQQEVRRRLAVEAP